MKFAFLVIAILINFFNHSLIKSEEKIFSAKNKIENIARKESITEEKTEIKKIHIVKRGDTITSISKFYSINKDLIIKLNNLKNIKSVAHYFLGNYDYAKRLLNENVYISVAKPFLRDEELSEVIKKLPLDQIVIETDSYPQYFKKNRQRWTEPKDLLLIIEKLSKLKNTAPEYITEQIEKNSKNILDL